MPSPEIEGLIAAFNIVSKLSLFLFNGVDNLG